MQTDKQLIIWNKKKLGLLVLTELIFLGVFGYLATLKPNNEHSVYIKTLSIVAVVILVISLPPAFHRLFEKAPALILDQEGIFANSVLTPWHMVKTIEIKKSFYGNTITIDKGYFKSSLILPVSLYKINFDELVNIVNQYYEKFGRPSPP